LRRTGPAAHGSRASGGVRERRPRVTGIRGNRGAGSGGTAGGVTGPLAGGNRQRPGIIG